jgi:sterol desaturase/sphingolipid hydroxylase (fatty acid hydroxylase superfamily)
MPEIVLPPFVASSLGTIGVILVAMTLVGLIELAIPLHKQRQWARLHFGPNLALTFITFATNIVFNVALVLALSWLQSVGFGLFNMVSITPLWSTLIVVVVLDFSFYVAHVAMHKIPPFWRVHRVHHSDPAVDVTTTIRQHPLEGVIRYAFIALFAIPLGASPAAFAVYRIASAVNGLFEHANIRVPRWLDGVLSLVTTWPNMHKIHHSRERSQTDTNYGNLFSLWDRLLSTFTSSRHGAGVIYGLYGFDKPAQQTLAGLLAAPFEKTTTQPVDNIAGLAVDKAPH